MPINKVKCNQAPSYCQWKIAHDKLVTRALKNCLLKLN